MLSASLAADDKRRHSYRASGNRVSYKGTSLLVPHRRLPIWASAPGFWSDGPHHTPHRRHSSAEPVSPLKPSVQRWVPSPLGAEARRGLGPRRPAAILEFLHAAILPHPEALSRLAP